MYIYIYILLYHIYILHICQHTKAHEHVADMSHGAFYLGTLHPRALAEATVLSQVRRQQGLYRGAPPYRDLKEVHWQRQHHLWREGPFEAPVGRQRIGRCRSPGINGLDSGHVQGRDHCLHPGGRPAQKLDMVRAGLREVIDNVWIARIAGVSRPCSACSPYGSRGRRKRNYLEVFGGLLAETSQEDAFARLPARAKSTDDMVRVAGVAGVAGVVYPSVPPTRQRAAPASLQLDSTLRENVSVWAPLLSP